MATAQSHSRTRLTSKPRIQIPKPMLYPELVFGLIGPAGTDLDLVIEVLTTELKAVDYGVEVIRLSKLIEEFLHHDFSKRYEDDRISRLMTDGSRIRELSGRGDAIAILSVSEIARRREYITKNRYVAASRTAYILRSLKHPQELRMLKSIYGRGFFAISVYSPREERVNALAERINRSRHLKEQGARSKAEALIERDEREEGTDLGQDVSDAFPLSDFFIDGRLKPRLQKDTKRLIEILFQFPYHTPTGEEYAMYHAKAAALRSAALSRQVGAVIASEHYDILAVGCNEVPKAGGGLYWTGDDPDGRDFQLGADTSNLVRQEILNEILDRFQKHKWLSKKYAKAPLDHLLNDLLFGNQQKVLRNSRVLHLIEFGRSVHAEMAALMDASRRGVSVKGATLFSTTFPCHLCARHIVASGIKRVVYIEPYPKSKVRELHPDSIVVDQQNVTPGYVNFEPFVGVAPRQYLELFEMPDERKDKRGKVVDWHASAKSPKVIRFLSTYILLEMRLIGEVIPEIRKTVRKLSHT